MPPVNSERQFVVALARVIRARLEGPSTRGRRCGIDDFQRRTTNGDATRVTRWVIPSSSGYEMGNQQRPQLACPVRSAVASWFFEAGQTFAARWAD
jgi:hypothetical protein